MGTCLCPDCHPERSPEAPEHSETRTTILVWTRHPPPRDAGRLQSASLRQKHGGPGSPASTRVPHLNGGG